MDKGWNDFKSLYGGVNGARVKFEEVCETLFRKEYKGHHVGNVKVKNGDGGVDVFIGELGSKPIKVIQCKFFIESFGDSQKNQIRESFKTAISSEKYEMEQWILCVPTELDIDENSWWFKWKHRQLDKHSKEDSFIKLMGGNELIDLFKEHNLYNQVFKIEDSIKLAEIHQAICPPNTKKQPQNIDEKYVLFVNYKIKCEPYYVNRICDNEFNEALNICNVWLYGKSGAGKTALINRNLIQNNIDYCFCDLSATTVTEANDVLIEILVDIEDKFSIERNKSEKNILKQISNILCDKCENEMVIVIDELSVPDDSTLKNIADKLIQLVTYYNNNADGDKLKFVVSTIIDPKSIITDKHKASNHFQYLSCDSWDNYLSQLFDTIANALNLEFDVLKQCVIDGSKSSPRIMKNIFKKIIIKGRCTTEEVIQGIIEEAQQETV